MRVAFLQLFWGFLFIMVEIHIIIDIFADPIGYYMIFHGLNLIAKEYGKTNPARPISVVLLFLSIPTVFIMNTSSAFVDLSVQMTAWSIYEHAMGLAQLVLTFYVFKIMLHVADAIGNRELYSSTNLFFKWYIGISLATQVMSPFLMNLYHDVAMGFVIGTVLISLIINIIFLIYLYRFKKSGQENRLPGNENAKI
ncbi:hypothetical protein [Pseudalkalibacillus sp. SCS-8]|uniref:hypothetical protein n=1 Tax=Pseudalkalibacillus nanhaiensis TaxID=3115291 RepID=UPI0032DB5AD0